MMSEAESSNHLALSRHPIEHCLFFTAISPFFQKTNSLTTHFSRPICSLPNTRMRRTFKVNDLLDPKTDLTRSRYNRIFTIQHTEGMRELIRLKETEGIHHFVHQLNPKKKKPCEWIENKLGLIIRHDELSSVRQGLINTKCTKQDHSEDERSMKEEKGQMAEDEMGSKSKSDTNEPKEGWAYYLHVPLNHSHLLPSTDRSQDPFFIHTLQQLSQAYQGHTELLLGLFVHLLEKQFRVVVGEGELRIYFPFPIPKSKQEAVERLEKMGIDQADYYSIRHEPRVGPDYFEDIQFFIHQIDTLIDQGLNVNQG